MERYLKKTRLLDFSHPSLTELVTKRGWVVLPEYEHIARIYDFVQNEVAFGYNEADDIPASKVFRDGFGQCNTKGALLVALLRRCGIPCRFHAFTIDKQLQKGVISGLAGRLAPRNFIHSWEEVWFGNKRISLEGFILDRLFAKARLSMPRSSRPRARRRMNRGRGIRRCTGRARASSGSSG